MGEDILPFTNTAAEIVHDAVTENGGQPNRNLGEAFLCVWKPDVGKEDPTLVSPQEQMQAETKMCDGALTAFRRCVRGIATSQPLQAYNQHEEIVKFFDGQRSARTHSTHPLTLDTPHSPHAPSHKSLTPVLTTLSPLTPHTGNYSTRIGYGLHYGWAIEGKQPAAQHHGSRCSSSASARPLTKQPPSFPRTQARSARTSRSTARTSPPTSTLPRA